MNGREMLRQLMEKKMSMGELSELSGVPLSRLHGILRSDKNAPPEEVLLLEKAFSAEHRVIRPPIWPREPVADNDA